MSFETPEGLGAFRYRAATPAGVVRTGILEGRSLADALSQLRRSGLTPLEATRVGAAQRRSGHRRIPVPGPLLVKTFGELAVMLEAGVALDRALAVLIEDMSASAGRGVFETILQAVREGRPLSRSVEDAGPAFPPMAAAMISAGEADGRPATALAKLSETLERAQALRATLMSAMVYPIMLLAIAAGVIALMLFWVVPQFEQLFTDANGALPPVTRAVLAISRWARRYSLLALGLGVGVAFGLSRLARRPEVRRWGDRILLNLPQIGRLSAMAESARFMRVLSSLVQGGVPLPDALAIARGSLMNTYMGAAVERVAKGLREGQGLTDPLAATGVFPRLAISYLRTGEQTAQLPMMLERLADALDREVRSRLERLVGILTPLITVAMGAIVATVIASIMTAILGFDDLALAK